VNKSATALGNEPLAGAFPAFLLEMTMNRFEVIARYAHGTYAEIILADSPADALRKAKPVLRRRVPAGYSILRWTVIDA